MNVLESSQVKSVAFSVSNPKLSTKKDIELPLEQIDVGTSKSVAGFFPRNMLEIQECLNNAKVEAEIVVGAIISVLKDERSFFNTFYALDAAEALLHSRIRALDGVTKLHLEANVRESAKQTVDELKNFSISTLLINKKLYKACQEALENIKTTGEFLSDQQRGHLENKMVAFRRNGLHLEEVEFDKLKQLKTHISKLETSFEKNIDDDQSHIWISIENLAGVPEQVIKGLEARDSELKVTCDGPTYFSVLEHCRIEKTRKDLFHAYNNRAAEKNGKILKDLVASRDQLANLLGYQSFAYYDIETQMAKTPEKVAEFINSIVKSIEPKALAEVNALIRDIPSSVTLGENNKIKPWDLRFLITTYKNARLQVDETKIQEYFPFEPTLEKLKNLYSQLFDLTITDASNEGFWDPSVRVLTVQRNKHLLGHIVLDLFPREGKFGHCYCLDVLAPYKVSGEIKPTIALVIANLTPSILQHSEVTTLFHELGHAFHQLLGCAEIPTLSGYHTKSDFLELPSQLLEKLMWEPEVLNQLGEHYQTKEPFPSALIQAKIASRTFGEGIWTLRQMTLAKMSLEFFEEGYHKNLTHIREKIEMEIVPFLDYCPENNSEAAFRHAADPLYASKYYSYEFADVFAADVYQEIKKRALSGNENPWLRYIKEILEPGGGVDPNVLLHNFLCRPPSIEAYKSAMGT